MKRSIKDRAKGRFHEVKGRVKEKVGKATNNRGLEAEGIVEKIAGKIQEKIGQVEKAVENRSAGTASQDPAATTLKSESKNRSKAGR